jgi:hypothetical protein
LGYHPFILPDCDYTLALLYIDLRPPSIDHGYLEQRHMTFWERSAACCRHTPVVYPPLVFARLFRFKMNIVFDLILDPIASFAESKTSDLLEVARMDSTV